MRNAELKTEPSFNFAPLQAGAESERSAFRVPRSALEPLLLFEHVSKWYGTVLALITVTVAAAALAALGLEEPRGRSPAKQ